MGSGAGCVGEGERLFARDRGRRPERRAPRETSRAREKCALPITAGSSTMERTGSNEAQGCSRVFCARPASGHDSEGRAPGAHGQAVRRPRRTPRRSVRARTTFLSRAGEVERVELHLSGRVPPGQCFAVDVLGSSGEADTTSWRRRARRQSIVSRAGAARQFSPAQSARRRTERSVRLVRATLVGVRGQPGLLRLVPYRARARWPSKTASMQMRRTGVACPTSTWSERTSATSPPCPTSPPSRSHVDQAVEGHKGRGG